jgi:hypothetical protein
MLCQHIYLDIYTLYNNNQRRAGVVKLVDAGDSKSPDSCSHVGSIPTSGTRINSNGYRLSLILTLFVFLVEDPVSPHFTHNEGRL